MKALVESEPDTSLILLDKCIKVEGTMRNPGNRKVTYDFFCLESKGIRIYLPSILANSDLYSIHNNNNTILPCISSFFR